MLTLYTLLPSDNNRLLGRFNGFLALLLKASDNIPILSGKKYMLYIYSICLPIENSSRSNYDNYTILIII